MTERESKLKPDEPFQELTEEQKAPLEAQNAIAQFDLLKSLVRDALSPPPRFRLRVSTLSKLNAVAIEGLMPSPGALRTKDIEIRGSAHAPPAWPEVQGLMEEMCDYVNDRWDSDSALHLASYVMWRLNWIHPFPDGNGRTSRAASYLVLCVRTGYLLPGKVTIPEQITANKRRYYRALEQADAADAAGNLDLSAMEELLTEYLTNQLNQVLQVATGVKVNTPVPPGPAWNND
ncbi:MAG: Fic family protein [Polyangiaceae bacterium]|nr:Fic family protein [Polyangiaceae bacterium]